MRRLHRRRFAAGLMLLCSLLSIVGCSSNPNRYKASRLPAAFRASRQTNVHTLPLANLAATYDRSERIGGGDMLEVTIATGVGISESGTFPTRVASNGNAMVPIIGEVAVGGLEPSEAESAIAAAAINRGLYRSPHVTVTLKRKRMNRITVTGAVKKPGVVELPRDACDLYAAIGAAEGLTDNAGVHVEIKNPIAPDEDSDLPAIAQASGNASFGGGFSNDASSNAYEVPAARRASPSRSTHAIQVDLVTAVKEGKGDRYRLEDGAVVHVEEHEYQPIQVMGLVRKPGPIPYPVGKDVSVLDAVALSGGMSSPVANKIYVIRRREENEEPLLIVVSVQSAKSSESENVLLQPGDVVSVEQTALTAVVGVLQTMVRVSLSSASLFY